MIKVIPKEDVSILCDKKYSNPRYNPSLFKNKLNIEDAFWVGCFDGDIKALAIISKMEYRGLSTYYIREIQSMEKGYGAELLNYLIDNYNNLWFVSDPRSEDTLKDYYRNFGLVEFNIEESVWNKPVSFFLNTEDPILKEFIKLRHSKQ